MRDAAGTTLASGLEGIIVPTSADIDRDVSLRISGPGYDAQAAIGRFGQLGVESLMLVPGTMTNDIFIASNEHVNVFAFPQRAKANFIIDGGHASMFAGPLSKLSMSISLESTIFDSSGNPVESRMWQGGFDLEVPEFDSVPIFTPFGEDISATFDGTVDIPLSLQTFDIGIVPPGGRVNVSYKFFALASIEQFSELTTWSFSDPLQILADSGEDRSPDVIFTAVPVLPGFYLLASAIALLPMARRRR